MEIAQNYTQLYKTINSCTQLYNTFTQLIKTSTQLDTVLHNFTHMVLYKTFTRLYKSLQYFTRLDQQVLKHFYKVYRTLEQQHVTQLIATLHNSTNVYNTLHKLLNTSQHFTTL